jgi:cell fate regulator YaaT (PSP1 superfamily)
VKGTAIRREVEFIFSRTGNTTTSIQNLANSVTFQNNPLQETANLIPNAGKSNYSTVMENAPQSQSHSQSADNYFTMKNLNNNLSSPPINSNLMESPSEVPNKPNIKENENNVSNPNSNTTKNAEIEKQLQDMKIEYYKYKHQLNNLTETYKNLKSRADNEKKGPDAGSLHATNCKF